MAQKLTSKDIVKHFAGVTALSSGCLTANSGEVVALMGANGSGKSTLCKIITGVVAPDEGQLLLNGTPISFSTPVEALRIRYCSCLPGTQPGTFFIDFAEYLADA